MGLEALGGRLLLVALWASGLEPASVKCRWGGDQWSYGIAPPEAFGKPLRAEYVCLVTLVISRFPKPIQKEVLSW